MHYNSFIRKYLICVIFIFYTCLLSGCASTSSQDNQESSYTGDPRDPLESINRPLWSFTESVDKYLARPISLFYGQVMHKFMREGLYNISQHFNEPSTIINQLLVLNFNDAAKTSGRFVLNSTIGLLGFYDPASDFGWTRNEKDFGEVLGRYGVSDGPYLIIPGIKPTTVRDEVGSYVDHLYWPYAPLTFWPKLARWTIEGMEKRILLVEQEDMLYEAVDSYEFVKNAYFQNMRYRVFDGNPPIEIDEDEEAELDAYLDEFEE